MEPGTMGIPAISKLPRSIESMADDETKDRFVKRQEILYKVINESNVKMMEIFNKTLSDKPKELELVVEAFEELNDYWNDYVTLHRSRLSQDELYHPEAWIFDTDHMDYTKKYK